MNLKLFILYTCFIINFVFGNVSAFSNSNDISFHRTYLDFVIKESEYSIGDYIIGDTDNLGYSVYNYKEMPFERSKDDRMLTLRSKFKLDSTFLNQNIYLVLLPIDYHCKIFLNGNILAERGFKDYTTRIHYSESVLLPQNVLKYNSINEIAIQLYPREGETYPISKMFITNAKDASKYILLRNSLGPKLIFGLTLCGFVFFLFFLVVYISRREYQKQQFLFFAFMNLFFFLSYVNNIFTYNFSNTFLLERLARLSFPLSVYVGICFMLEYTNVFKHNRKIKLLLLVVYIPAIIMILIPDSTTDIIRIYNTYPIFTLFFGTFILFGLSLKYFLRERSIKSVFLLAVFFLNIVAGLYDGYYFAILKTKPFVLFTPITVFFINLVIFFIIAVDHSKLYHLALNSSEKLEKLNQDLELQVEKRTQKTKEYASKLEEANKTKDKFFSIIAHDLKNPFNTLIGYSEILKSEFRDYGPDEIYQQLHIIFDTSVKGYNLLENLLKWSQSQTDKIEFNPKNINLYEIVQFCINDVEYQCQFKDIELLNDVSKDIDLIADKNLIKTVLRNLIGNAVKFTSRNGLISISAINYNSKVEISVKDSGIGMSQEEVSNLFKIDKLFSKPGTEKETGSGLGLILCKEFIEKHDGKIWVESKPDVGSNFKFTIPQQK